MNAPFTAREKLAIEYALGLNESNTTYKNEYSCYQVAPIFNTFENLRKRGYATKLSAWNSDQYVFSITKEGIRKFNKERKK